MFVLGSCGWIACGDGDAMKPVRDVDASASAPAQPTHDAAPPMHESTNTTSSELTRPAFCDRESDDAIRDLFCAEPQPIVRSLEDLQDLLNINPRAPDPDKPAAPFAFSNVDAIAGFVAVLGHSTALPGHLISPINPRAIIMGDSALLAFQRGVQRLELATPARGTASFNFYLFTFEQACNRADEGCSPGDLYTPAIESDWIATQIRDEEELKNTASDCRQCHRRGRDDSTLLMRELQSPWTHFFSQPEMGTPLPGVNGGDLLIDYVNAKDGELYGGLAVETVAPTSPFRLQMAAGAMQPLLFDSPQIQTERWPYGPNGYGTTPLASPTWEHGYEAFKRGEQLALPYLEQRATDADKQAELTRAYRRYRAGEIEASELPDLADIFPDDPQLRARIGLQTEPDAAPEDALIQACAPCHNDVLDQTISRARFNIAIGRLDRAELDTAIERIELPRDAPGAMPPPESRQLDEQTRSKLVDYLRGDLRASDIDPRLEHAATIGMTGGGKMRRD
jgi:hypothetical protein